MLSERDGSVDTSLASGHCLIRPFATRDHRLYLQVVKGIQPFESGARNLTYVVLGSCYSTVETELRSYLLMTMKCI